MIKYLNTRVTFSEVPDEISLCINITNCPCHCKGCHSSFLAEDTGTELTSTELLSLIDKNPGISCVCFMGGDADPDGINLLAMESRIKYPLLKVAWYSGKQELSKGIFLELFDYIKLGPYEEDKGPLDKETTNQKFYEIVYSESKDNNYLKPVLQDITFKFWKK